MPFDLADALGGDAPDQGDVGQLGLTAVQQAVAAADHVGRPGVERAEQVFESLAVDGVQHEVVGAGRRVACQEVAQRGVAVGFDRGVQADVLAGQAQQVDHQVDVVAQLGCDLFDLGLATELAFEVAPDGGDLVDLLGDCLLYTSRCV